MASLRALLVISSLAVAGLMGACGSSDDRTSEAVDLGECDAKEARALLVRADGKIEYAGQAIVNASCASGECHASSATGAGRHGAPIGVDFDLEPASAVAGTQSSPGVRVDAKALETLRVNQQRIFDLAADIWGRVSKGAMPPRSSTGSIHRLAVAGAPPLLGRDSCQRGKSPVGPVTEAKTQEILRNWLACGAPLVEASDPTLRVQVLGSDFAGRPGTVGQQLPLCGSGCEEWGDFDTLYAAVLGPACGPGCHTPDGIWPELDLSAADTAYDALLASKGGGACNPDARALVVPGDAAASYLVAKMGGSDISKLTVCGALEPSGQPKLECGVRQVAGWIDAGAKR